MSEDNKEGYSWVTAARYRGKEEVSVTETQERLSVPNFNNLPTARVTVSGHMTKNLGNYESARIGVEVSLPCYPVEEEVVRVYTELQELVGSMLDDQAKGFDPVQ